MHRQASAQEVRLRSLASGIRWAEAVYSEDPNAMRIPAVTPGDVAQGIPNRWQQ